MKNQSKMTPEHLTKMDACRHLLPEPGPEVAGDLIKEIWRLREALMWIASQQNLFFAECSQAEEIVFRCKEALLQNESVQLHCPHCSQTWTSTIQSWTHGKDKTCCGDYPKRVPTKAFPVCQKHQDVRISNGQCYRCNLEQAKPTMVSMELVDIIRKAMDRCGFDQSLDIKWLIELPMTDAEHRRFMDLIGKPGRTQPNELT